MLGDIESLARSYLKCKNGYENGLIGNPFPILPEPYGQEAYKYADGLIAGDICPGFMTNPVIVYNLDMDGEAIKKYKHVKYILKYYAKECIEKGFFRFYKNRESDTMDELLSIVLDQFKKDDYWCSDSILYEIMGDTDMNYISLLKFDSIDDCSNHDCSNLIKLYDKSFKARVIEVLGPIVKSRQADLGVSHIISDLIGDILDKEENYDCKLLYKIINYIRYYGDVELLNKLVKQLYHKPEFPKYVMPDISKPFNFNPLLPHFYI